jgi:hypothetical protein
MYPTTHQCVCAASLKRGLTRRGLQAAPEADSLHGRILLNPRILCRKWNEETMMS